MRFTKMEGLGNDYIYLNCLSRRPPDPAGLAVRLSDRHFGVGADGLICVCPGRRGDFAMEMYNADGSRGKMCGNGSRCLGQVCVRQGAHRRTSLQVDTDSGLRALRLLPGPAGIGQVEVDMGEPLRLSPDLHPSDGAHLLRHARLYGQPPLHPLPAPTRRRSPWTCWALPWSATPSFPTGPTWNLWPWRGISCGCGCGSRGSGRDSGLAAPAPAPPWLPPTSWDCAPQSHRPSPRRLPGPVSGHSHAGTTA